MARAHRPAGATEFHQAEAASSLRSKSRSIAKRGDLHPMPLGGLENGLPLVDLNLPVVDPG
jgi:hypothetical protein